MYIIYHNSCYLNCKHQLQKFIFIFRDKSVFPVVVYISPWTNAD